MTTIITLRGNNTSCFLWRLLSWQYTNWDDLKRCIRFNNSNELSQNTTNTSKSLHLLKNYDIRTGNLHPCCILLLALQMIQLLAFHFPYSLLLSDILRCAKNQFQSLGRNPLYCSAPSQELFCWLSAEICTMLSCASSRINLRFLIWLNPTLTIDL